MERLHSPRTLEAIRRHHVTKESDVSYYKIINSPVGRLTLIANDSALTSLLWSECAPTYGFIEQKKNAILGETEEQLKEYFDGDRTAFNLPLAPKGTEFQMRVWAELLKVPYGQYITYGEQARRLGNPQSARAVGAANGKNPIGIIVPCHRVLGASGSLTGFAWGLQIKKELLELEGVRVNKD